MAERLTRVEERALLYALARASEQGWGIAMGLLLGLGLLLATAVLVAKGSLILGATSWAIRRIDWNHGSGSSM